MLKHKSLELFALEVEQTLEKGGTTLVKQICRHLVGDDPKISSFMAAKLVEWGYGKPTERVQHTGLIEHEHRTVTEQLTDDELAQAEHLIETAFARSNKG